MIYRILISRNEVGNMIDENIFVCGEIDEEEDYSDEFKEVVDSIIERSGDGTQALFGLEHIFQLISVYSG